MNVRIRPVGYVFIGLAAAALLFRLFYTLFIGDHIDYADLMDRLNIPHATPAPPAPTSTTPTEPTAPSPAAQALEASQPIKDWLVLAPIPSGVSMNAEGKADGDVLGKILDKPYLANEGSLQPHAGDVQTVNGVQRTWKTENNDRVDLRRLAREAEGKPETTEYNASAAYAVANINLPKDVSNATLYLGSDDGVKVWLNGQEIHRNTAVRGCNVGDDKLPNLILHAGTNTFVFKVANGDGDWQVMASLETP